MGAPKLLDSGTSKAAKAERDVRFIEAYFALGENGTQAVLRVKPHLTVGSAAVEAHKLLNVPKIQAAIEKRRLQIRAKFSLTTDRVAQEWARLGYFNPKKLVDSEGKPIPLHLLDDDTAAALGSVELVEETTSKDGVVTVRKIKVRPFNKNPALASASKILRLYDKPPPPPDDPNALDDKGRLERARRIAFAMVQGARLAKAAPKKPEPAAKKSTTTTA